MAVRKIDKREWAAFCDAVSKGLSGQQAEIEVDSLALGTQIEAHFLPLLGIVYDPKDDIIEIALDGLDHLINHPRELLADIGPSGLATFEIVDGDNTHQIVKLRDPLLLPFNSGGSTRSAHP
jgi:hypothetical protein